MLGFNDLGRDRKPPSSLSHYHSSRFQVGHFAGENKSYGRAMMFRKEKYGSLYVNQSRGLLHNSDGVAYESTIRPDNNGEAIDGPHCLTFLNIHDLEDTSPAIVFPPKGGKHEEIDESTSEILAFNGHCGTHRKLGKHSHSEWAKLQCKICDFVHVNSSFKCKVRFDAHIRAMYVIQVYGRAEDRG